MILGLIAGYFGGAADMIIMRFTDMVMSFPYILLVLVAASIFKPGLWSIILILGFVDWPGIARLVRGNVLSLRESNFIKSDLVAGMPLPYILFSEILPNTAAPILVYATSVLALSMLDEAALFVPRNGCAAADREPWKHVKRRAVADCTDETAVALDSVRADDRGAGHCD